jgi:hypothetical protein
MRSYGLPRRKIDGIPPLSLTLPARGRELPPSFHVQNKLSREAE